MALFLVVWMHAAWQSGLRRGFFWDAREGRVLFWVIRGLVLVSVIGLPGALWWPAWFSPLTVDWPAAVRTCGLLLVLAGSGLFLAVTRALGRHFSTSLHLREDHRLVTQGPYRWIRHPMYLAYLLSWTGFLLLTGNVLAVGAGIIAFVLAMVVRVGREEAMLEAAFGAEWVAYRERTGRFLPVQLRPR